MLIEKGQKFADMEAKQVRNLLRAARRQGGSYGWERPDELSDAAWRHLEDEQMVEPGEDGTHLLTIKGNAFANARIGKPIPRAKARDLLADVVARAEELNREEPGTVRSIDVFGSYTTDAEMLGDIDLVVDVGLKWDPRLPVHENYRRTDHVYARLRNRSQYISFCERGCMPPGVTVVRVFDAAKGAS